MKNTLTSIALAAGVLVHGAALADINIGVIGSVTGPGAAIGGDVKRSADLLAAMYKNEKINVIFLDDASDTNVGVQNLRRMISDHRIDALVGSNTTGPAMGMAQVATEEKIAMIAIAPIDLKAINSPWVFRASQSPDLFVQTIVQDMPRNNIKTVSYIGFADGWGDALFKGLSGQAPKAGIRITADERFKRPDTTVTAQVVRAMAPQPDAVFIGGAGAPAVLPQAGLFERGYKGKIYQNAVATKEFVRLGGKAVEGAMVPVGTVMVNEQLADANPVKAAGKRFLDAYEGKYGAETRSMFAGYAWDALGLLRHAAMQVRNAEPGTPQFRQQLRDALESASYVGATGRYTFSASDHAGIGADSLVLVSLDNGQWKLVK
jgi:branched-chain amino acid transport system substrate-binding protein